MIQRLISLAFGIFVGVVGMGLYDQNKHAKVERLIAETAAKFECAQVNYEDLTENDKQMFKYIYVCNGGVVAISK